VRGGENALFSGDHLAYSASRQGLDGFKRYNKGNAKVQGDSIRLLAGQDVQFQWLIPGHGRMLRFATDEERVEAILRAAEVFDGEDDAIGKFGVGYF
jgi:glyoxylase-like metal-dependent hydrolase (beta-lactamase superfamily II)